MRQRLHILAALCTLILVLGSLPASAYNYLYVNSQTGKPTRWEPGSTIRYYLDPGAGDENVEELKTVLQEAMLVWESVPNANAPHFEFIGYLPEDVTGENYQTYVSSGACFTSDLSQCTTEYQKNLESVIVFDSDQSIVQKLCWAGECAAQAGPKVFEIDGDLNIISKQGQVVFGRYSLSNPSITAGVMVHELGHLLGLAHPVLNQQLSLFPADPDIIGYPDILAATMDTNFIWTSINPTYNQLGNSTATNLNPDDAAGIQTLYPDDTYSVTFATLRGTVLKKDGTPMTYAVVTARDVNDPWCNAYSILTGRSCEFGSTALCEQNGKANGDFVLGGLPPGSYLISVEGIPPANEDYYLSVAPLLWDATFAGHAEFWNEGDGADEDPLLSTAVTLAAGEERQIDFILDDSVHLEATDESSFPEVLDIRSIGPVGTTACVLSDKDWYALIGRTPSISAQASPAGGCSLVPR